MKNSWLNGVITKLYTANIDIVALVKVTNCMVVAHESESDILEMPIRSAHYTHFYELLSHATKLQQLI